MCTQFYLVLLYERASGRVLSVSSGKIKNVHKRPNKKNGKLRLQIGVRMATTKIIEKERKRRRHTINIHYYCARRGKILRRSAFVLCECKCDCVCVCVWQIDVYDKSYCHVYCDAVATCCLLLTAVVVVIVFCQSRETDLRVQIYIV